MRKETLLLFISLTYFATSYSQLSSELSNLVPSSPSVEQFKKHVSFPVNYYTGTPTITQGIYNFNIDGLNFSISLSYHASGIRVTETPSWVGLGWSLNVGGTISREVRGTPDNLDGGYNQINNSKEFVKFLNLNSKYNNNNLSDSDKLYVENFRKKAIKTPYDTEPDIYTFNVMGISGEFVYDANGNIMLLNKQDVIIKGNPNSGFIITDSRGNTFWFEASEVTDVFPDNIKIGEEWGSSSLVDDYGYTSAWKLSKIITFLGKEVKLSYTSIASQNHSEPIEKFNFYTINNKPSQSRSFGIIRSFTDEKLLSRIDFPNGSITFEMEKDGTTYGRKLSFIIIVNNNFQLVKKLKLDYNKVQNDEGTRRLLLESVQELSESMMLPKTIFTYHSTSMPSYDSKSVDLWGFFNGKTNLSFVPKRGYLYLDYQSGGGSFSKILADRSPDFNSTMSCVLKKVQHTTGGYTTYKFEQNDFGFINNSPVTNGGSLEDIEYTTKMVTRLTSCSEEECFEELIGNCNDENFDTDVSYTSNYGYNTQTFVAPKSINGYFFIYARLDGSGENMASAVTLEDSKGRELYRYQNVNGSSFPSQTSTIDAYGDPNVVILKEGETYKLTSNVDDICRISVISIKKLITKEGGGSEVTNRITGGIRIKEINKFDHDNSLQLRRTFEYNISKDSLRSSGVIKSGYSPKIVTTSSSYGAGETLVNTEMMSLFSTPIINYGSTKGSHVSYRKVIENILNNQNESSQNIIYEYISPYSFQDDYGSPFFPYLNRINFDYRLGLLHKKTEVNQKQESVRETNYNYKFIDRSFDKKIAGFSIGASVFRQGIPDKFSIKVNEYYHKNIRTSLIEKEEVTLSKNNMKTIKKYFYGKQSSSLITKTEVTNSKNEIVIASKTTYPQDITLLNRTLAEKQLITEHRIATPISVEKFNSEMLLNKQHTRYYTTKDGLTLPKEIQTLKGGTSNSELEPRITYHDYDDKGNPLEVSKKDGTRICYIWGYNKTQVIAKIENASYSQVSMEVKNLQTLSYADNDRTLGALGKEGALRSALQDLRILLSDVQVTSYTYDPLIGVTSITNPRGETIYYHYDDFNRLAHVKDAQGNILSKNKYNYKKQ